MHSGRGRAQANLRLVDRIRPVNYAEDTVQWPTDTAEETYSHSDSTLDSSDSHGMTALLMCMPYSICSNRSGF